MTTGGRPDVRDTRPARAGRIAVALAGLFVFVTLIALGAWQVQRLGWKLDLIARVDARVHAEPAPPPAAAVWPAIGGEEYRRLRLDGTFRNDRETLVQAVTALGPGFWVLTPLQRANGETILVNRGFVPPDRRDPASRMAGQIEGPTTVTGLLRLSEPGGGFLRANDPVGGRWYSRDVAAITSARGLTDTAPYFIDADAAPNIGGWPVGGLTVIAFTNHHLVYATTWFTLAAMLAAVGVWAWRARRRPAASQIGEDGLSAPGSPAP